MQVKRATARTEEGRRDVIGWRRVIKALQTNKAESLFARAPGGTVQLGLGGGRVDGFVTPIAGSLARYNTTYGAVRLRVTETNFVSDFINIFNQVIDTFTLEAVPARLALQWVSGLPSILLHGTPGHPYITEVSTSLIHWTSISTNRLVSTSTNLVDPGFSGHPARFYGASNWR